MHDEMHDEQSAVMLTFSWMDHSDTDEWVCDGPEVERFWLPAIGPTSIILMRRIMTDMREASDGVVRVPEAKLSRALGLGERQGKNAPLRRTLQRLTNFGLGKLDETFADHHNEVMFQLRKTIRPPGPGVQKRYPEFLKPELMEAINAIN